MNESEVNGVTNTNINVTNVNSNLNLRNNQKSNKKISFMFDNLSSNISNNNNFGNLSTTANLHEGNTHRIFSKSVTTKFNKGQISNNSRSILTKLKDAKREIIGEIEQQISNISPKNVEINHINQFNKKGKTEGFKLNQVNRLNSNLPSVGIKESEVNSQNSSYSVMPKKLTKKIIEEEKKYLKDYIRNHITSLDDTSIYKNLRIPKANKNVQKMQEYVLNQNKLKTMRESSANSSIEINHNHRSLNLLYHSKPPSSESSYSKERAKLIENSIKNPSLGSECLRKTFHELRRSNKNSNSAKNNIPIHIPITYENRFKHNYTKKYLGSVLYAKRVNLEDDTQKYENVKNTKFTQVSKLKMKWKTIKWIIENKKDVLDRLMDFYEVNLTTLTLAHKKANEIDKGLNKAEFTKLMKSNGITNDMSLINKLFWVFDEDGDQFLKFKEIAFGIEMFRDSPIEQKLKAFFDLCDVDNSGSISKQEFMNLLRKNIINNDEKISMKQVVDKIFSCVKLDKNGEITFEKLKEGCEKNKEIQDIIYKNLLALRSIDTVIDKDIKKDIMRFNPELNDQLRMKLLHMKTSFIPLRTEKFVNLIEGFISNKEKLLEINKIREVNEDDESFEVEEEEIGLFKEERDLVRGFMNMRQEEMSEPIKETINPGNIETGEKPHSPIKVGEAKAHTEEVEGVPKEHEKTNGHLSPEKVHNECPENTLNQAEVKADEKPEEPVVVPEAKEEAETKPEGKMTTPAKAKTPAKKSAAKKEPTTTKKSASKEADKTTTAKKPKKEAEEKKESARGRSRSTTNHATPLSKSKDRKVNNEEFEKYANLLNKKTSRPKKQKSTPTAPTEEVKPVDPTTTEAVQTQN